MFSKRDTLLPLCTVDFVVLSIQSTHQIVVSIKSHGLSLFLSSLVSNIISMHGKKNADRSLYAVYFTHRPRVFFLLFTVLTSLDSFFPRCSRIHYRLQQATKIVRVSGQNLESKMQRAKENAFHQPSLI